MSLNRFAEACLAHFFFFFFSFQIFSPAIGGRTLYLEYIVVMFNPFFWVWVSRLKLSRRTLFSILAAVFFVPFYTVAAVKLIAVIIGVMFLAYCRDRQLFFLKSYIYVSVLVAAVQFSLLMTGNDGLAMSLGPKSLASMVWGQHAAMTFTNFYTIFLFPRVSGLSREAGFFASFLITGYLAILANRSLEQRPLTVKANGIFVLGYVLSFSKISLAGPAAVLIVLFRRFVDFIPLIFIGAGFLAALTVFWNHFEAVLFLQGNGTFLGRLGAYTLIDDLNLHQLLFGVSDITDIRTPLAGLLHSYGYTELFGLGGWVLQNGIVAFALYMLALQLLGIRGSGFLFVLLMTATVGIDTNQNFCVLAYYFAFMLPRVQRLIVFKRSCVRLRFRSRASLVYG